MYSIKYFLFFCFINNWIKYLIKLILEKNNFIKFDLINIFINVYHMTLYRFKYSKCPGIDRNNIKKK